MKLYDEKVEREVPVTWERQGAPSEDGVDVFYLRVTLFKLVAEESKGLSIEKYPVYLLREEYTSYEGAPAEASVRFPTNRVRNFSYVTGPDSKRIRQCIDILNGFGGARSYNSN